MKMLLRGSVFAAAWLLAGAEVYGSTFVMAIDPAVDMAGAVAELRTAISGTNIGGGTVGLFPGGTYEFSDVYSGLNALPPISAQVTIQGNGATLRRAAGGPSMRFLNIAATGSLTVHDLTLAGGSAGNTTGGAGHGGAIRNAGQLFMSNSIVRDTEATSTATIEGGAVYNLGSFTASDCSFLNNEVNTSGGEVQGGVISSSGPLLDLQDCLIAENRANNASAAGVVRGAGILVSNFGSNVVTLTRCEIRDNESNSMASILGVGFSAETSDSAELSITLDSCTMTGNRGTSSAAAAGGGVFLLGHSGHTLVASITNCTISGNIMQGSTNGGGAYVNLMSATSSALFDHCTITNNVSSTDGGIRSPLSSGGTLTVGNSIVAGNTASNYPDMRGPVTSLNYSLIGNPSGLTVPGGATGNILNADAKLGPLANNGGGLRTHTLLAGSPAIDAADPASTVTIDQRGQARPFDSGYGLRSDIGAVEVQLARLDSVGLADPDGTGNTDTAVYTNQNPVTLTLSGVAGATPTALRYSNEADLSTYTEDTFDSGGPYSVTLSPAGDGPKNLYVALPAADGLSQIRSAIITLDTVAPVTEAAVASGVIAQPSSTFDVSFTSSDATSGLQGVRLFYRHNGGAWTQYGAGLFTSSPITFDTANAEGNGTYEFYTAGVDNAGNVEDKSAQAAEATVVYTNNTHVMSWQQIED